MVWSIVSNAALKSRRRRREALPVSREVKMSVVMFVSAVSTLCPEL
jgi:hypothetical protein